MPKQQFQANLQPSAAGYPCYRLLNVQVLRNEPHERTQDRFFVETESHLLLLSNAHDGRLVIDGRLHVLRPGSLFVCRPGQLLELTNYSGHPLELLLLHFTAVFPSANDPAAASAGREPELPFPAEASIASAATVGHLFGAIVASWNDGSPSSRLRCEAGLLELLSLALAWREQMTEMALEAARLELERHYARDLTVDELARIAGLSRFHFMRLFKERYGRGVMEYRTDLRLREAKRLMSEPGARPLADIVSRIGYRSESHFSNLFKKQTGIAPAVYQRNQKRKIAAYSWINLGQIVALQTIPFAAPLDQYWTDHYRSKYEYEVKVRLSHRYDFNLNALREARPDRIVAMGSQVPQEEQDKLRELAPTLFLNGKNDWRTHLRSVAVFLEREDAAEAWLARYERDAAIVRERLRQVVSGEAVLVLAVGSRHCAAWGRRAGTVLYDDLGLAAPAGIEDFEWEKPVEPADLASFGADRIVVHVGRSPAAEAHWDRLRRSEPWRQLPAVRRGGLHLASGAVFEAPWNEHAADPLGRMLNEAPRLFGCGD